MSVQKFKIVLFSIWHAGGEGTDPFAAREEEKPKQEVPQVSSPQPASPTGTSGQDRFYCTFGSHMSNKSPALTVVGKKKVLFQHEPMDSW